MNNEGIPQEKNQEIDREDQAEKIFDFLEKIDAKRIFKDEQSRLEFIHNLTPDDAKEWLARIDGIITDTPIKERTLTPEGKVIVSDREGRIYYSPPYKARKEKLLEEILEGSKKLKSSKDVGLLYASQILNLHFFKDGNGRMARLVYSLFSKDHLFDETDKSEILNALSERKKAIPVHTTLIDKEVHAIVQKRYARIDPNDQEQPRALFHTKDPKELIEILKSRTDLEPSQQKSLYEMFEDTVFSIYAYTRFFKDKKRSGEFVVASEDPQYSGKGIDVLELCKQISSKDADELLIYYDAIKMAYIKLCTDIIVNPKDYKDPNNPNKTLKDLFIERIEKTQ